MYQTGDEGNATTHKKWYKTIHKYDLLCCLHMMFEKINQFQIPEFTEYLHKQMWYDLYSISYFGSNALVCE